MKTVLLTTVGEITDDEERFFFSLYNLLMDAWQSGSVIIATPNIPLAELNALKKELANCANAESLDLDAIVFASTEGGDPKETERWELGWDKESPN